MHFNSTSRYLYDLLNMDNIHFKHMVHSVIKLNQSKVEYKWVAIKPLNQRDMATTTFDYKVLGLSPDFRLEQFINCIRIQ